MPATCYDMITLGTTLSSISGTTAYKFRDGTNKKVRFSKPETTTTTTTMTTTTMMITF